MNEEINKLKREFQSFKEGDGKAWNSHLQEHGKLKPTDTTKLVDDVKGLDKRLINFGFRLKDLEDGNPAIDIEPLEKRLNSLEEKRLDSLPVKKKWWSWK